MDQKKEVLFLPALCCKMGIPYCIVKDKARLGYVVLMRKSFCVALIDVAENDRSKLSRLKYKDCHLAGTKTLSTIN
ncbi:60S ribosomal protein L7a-like isoform X2 [Portunus trituberculatus]|uniref:60S ribosomal protein L7a-like isoform X2 n=1 Tax=Portunus trituberculatus TaxID=210409 RepID=UPI001E1CEF19|nr:60S ribosomal protein L7a-like isoform X2 [Portunus trituberculatus]